MWAKMAPLLVTLPHPDWQTLPISLVMIVAIFPSADTIAKIAVAFSVYICSPSHTFSFIFLYVLSYKSDNHLLLGTAPWPLVGAIRKRQASPGNYIYLPIKKLSSHPEKCFFSPFFCSKSPPLHWKWNGRCQRAWTKSLETSAPYLLTVLARELIVGNRKPFKSMGRNSKP